MIDTTTAPATEAPTAPENEIRDTSQVGSWPFGGDHVSKGTGHYPAETREMVRWLFEVSQQDGLSLKDAAAAIGYDSTVLYRVCLGRYEGSLKNVTKAILGYRSSRDTAREITGGAFIELSITRDMFRVFRSAAKYHKMGLITSIPQMGKSETGTEYMRQNNHGKTKFIRMPASAGVQLVMKEFATACRISRDQPYETLRERVLKAIDSNHLIIIDEGEQMFATYQKQSRMKVIETLREIHDRTKCGMVIIAAPTFEDELEEGNLAIMLKKFGYRCPFRLHLPAPEKLPASDLTRIAAAHNLPAPGDAEEESLRDILREESLAGVFLAVQAGAELAENKKQTFAWKHVFTANDIIHKGRRQRRR